MCDHGASPRLPLLRDARRQEPGPVVAPAPAPRRTDRRRGAAPGLGRRRRAREGDARQRGHARAPAGSARHPRTELSAVRRRRRGGGLLRRPAGQGGARRCGRRRSRPRRRGVVVVAHRRGPPVTQATVPVRTAPRRRGYSTAWWGMVMLITTEAMIFLSLLSAYFFVRATASAWPIGGLPLPELHRTIIFSIVLIGSSVPILWMEHALKLGRM